MSVSLIAAVALATPAPAQKPEPCRTIQCRARVAHRQCSNRRPRTCVLHVVYHRRMSGWKRSWMLRIPACESGWNPRAYNPSDASGLYQFMPSTWASTPYGRRSIWSARWQPYAAAWMLGQGRSGEWVCR